MRFISKYQNYSHRIRSHREMVLANGDKQVIQEGVQADFVHGDMTENERLEALRVFRFGGMPTELDEVTPIDPSYRLSCYDTSYIQDPVLRKEIEEKMTNSPSNGIDYLMFEVKPLDPPWPTYDKFAPGKGNPLVETLVQKVVSDGHDLEYVVAYEKENQNRSEVIAGLVAAKGVPVEPENVVLA